ncbi:hypothetical protein NPIL_103751, partial [Nephila pilipes]
KKFHFSSYEEMEESRSRSPGFMMASTGQVLISSSPHDSLKQFLVEKIQVELGEDPGPIVEMVWKFDEYAGEV